MHDTLNLDELIDAVKAVVVDTCARSAEIHRIRHIENDFHRGYNAAVTEIAANIREIKEAKV